MKLYKKMEKAMPKSDQEKQRRLEEFERLRVKMREMGYKDEVRTISIVKANLMLLVTSLPIAVVCFIIFFIKWRTVDIVLSPLDFLLFVLFVVLCILLHEGLHGLTWGLFCKRRWKSIHFGFIKEYLTPYCHCEEQLRWWYYILGGLMPLVVLGIGLFVIAFYTGSFLLLAVSLINILTTSGDLTNVMMSVKYRKALIFDHPVECGFVAFFL